jgi:hypothetical protein
MARVSRPLLESSAPEKQLNGVRDELISPGNASLFPEMDIAGMHLGMRLHQRMEIRPYQHRLTPNHLRTGRAFADYAEQGREAVAIILLSHRSVIREADRAHSYVTPDSNQNRHRQNWHMLPSLSSGD